MDEDKPCRTCKGRGKWNVMVQTKEDTTIEAKFCNDCAGTGIDLETMHDEPFNIEGGDDDD